jgi:excisionase family DNA binding protein
MPSTPTKPRDHGPLWSDEQTADYLGVSRVTVRRMRSAKELPTVYVRGAARTPRAAVLAYVAA